MSARVRRRRAVLLLALALACGGLAASQVSGRVAEVESAVGSPVAVVVATRDVAAGATLRKRDLALRKVPRRFVPPDALASPGDAVGLALAAQLASGSYVTAASIGPVGGGGARAGGPAPGPLRRGERAVEVAVAGGAALSSVASPGSRVDVLVSTEPAAGPGASFLALENVELLDLGGGGGGGGGGGAGPAASEPGPATAAEPGTTTNATLRVTVRQAVYLTAAQNFAREVRLLPRPAGDRERSGRTAISADGL
ncbi:MAG: Flp pilus assembly protein CpaB [Thermoleophilaceae bacterium]